MQTVLKIVFALAIIALGWYLIKSVYDPVKKQEEFDKIKSARVDRLKKIRTAQFAYKNEKREYAAEWDSLLNFIKYDSLPVVRTIGDPNDTTQQIISDTTYIAVKDSLFKDKFPVDSLPYVPMAAQKNARFELRAGTVSQGGTRVPVFMVRDTVSYRKGFQLQVGSLDEARTTGNWE